MTEPPVGRRAGPSGTTDRGTRRAHRRARGAVQAFAGRARRHRRRARAVAAGAAAGALKVQIEHGTEVRLFYYQ